VRLRFDHGTVLLEGVPREVDVRGGPDLHWDPRVSCWRAPAAEAPEIAARLSTRYGPLLRDDSSPWRTHPSPDLGRLTQIPAALRPYQQAALWAWTQSGRRGVVVLPTGAGKTWVALAAIATTQVPSLVCVPTRVLMHQWRAQLEAHLSPAQVGCWGDGRFVTRGVTVATFESAYRHLGRHGDRFGLLVLDEVHHFAGPGQTRRALLEMSVAPYRLGLTATPPGAAAADRPGETPEAATAVEAAALLAHLVGPVVFRASLHELTGSYLAPVSRITLLLDLTPAERQAYEREMGVFRAVHWPYRLQHPRASWNEFLAEALRTEQGQRAVAAWRAARRMLGYSRAKAQAVAALLARHRQERVLIFTGDNATAYRIAREHLIMPITCDIGRAERAAALARFGQGTLRALVSSRVLNEGVDVPDAGVCILVGGGSSAREYVQRIGRVLRPRPGKEALVYEMITRATAEARQARSREASLGPLVSGGSR